MPPNEPVENARQNQMTVAQLKLSVEFKCPQLHERRKQKVTGVANSSTL